MAFPAIAGMPGQTVRAVSGSRRTWLRKASALPPFDVARLSESPLLWMCLAAVLTVIILYDKMPVALGLDSSDRQGMPTASGLDDDWWPLARALGDNSSNTSSTSGAAQDAHGDHAHPHVAMFFLVAAIMIGASITHMVSFDMFKGVPQTVALFGVGVVFSLWYKALRLDDFSGNLGMSYNMWMAIDPHLLLMTMLPPLLAGDAMTIDTHVASTVARQCLYLAGPGVLIQALSAAAFLWVWLPYNWEFLLCLTTGSILCATDPVAVVALLKELGASPTLTVQIQGEALLNDGTAIVLYTVAYNMLAGEDYGFGDIMIFLIKTALYAWILGMMIGGAFYIWIKMANKKLDHSSSMIQVSLTLACAYASFIVAEGVFKVSGVLSTVAASLVLAHFMWPEIVAKETLLTIWHAFEYLGNTIIFLLAGALTGSAMWRIVSVSPLDFIHLFVIYLALLCIRTGLVVISRPLLKRLSATREPVPLADALVIGWGGLRGAVGLVLAIQVSRDQAGGNVSTEDSDRVLFYVGGVALLTLLINATTCPKVVNYLGLTATPKTKKRLMLKLHEQLEQILRKHKQDHKISKPVEQAITRMLQEIEQKLELRDEVGVQEAALVRSKPLGGLGTVAEGSRLVEAQDIPEIRERVDLSEPERRDSRNSQSSNLAHAVKKFRSKEENLDLIDNFTESKDKVMRHIEENTDGVEFLQRLVNDMPFSGEKKEEELIKVLKNQRFNTTCRELLRGINEAFLHLIEHNYWQQLEAGTVTTATGRVLLESVTHALSTDNLNNGNINDFDQIREDLSTGNENQSRATWIRGKSVRNHKPSNSTMSAHAAAPKCLSTLLDSTGFNVFVMLAILGNCVLVFAEEYEISAGEQAMFGLEMAFNIVFTIEFGLKVWGYRLEYFKDSWNIFDFALVIVGWAGLALIYAVNNAGTTGQETDLARTIKILKILRALRMARLVRQWQDFKAKLVGKSSEEAMKIEEHMQKFDCVMAFIQAHSAAQVEIMRFFGTGEEHKIEGISLELAHCILQSMLSVYDAIHICIYEKRHFKPWMLPERDVCLRNIVIIRDLEDFLEGAMKRGLLSQNEAEMMIHSMHHHIEEFMHRVDDLRHGRTVEPKYVEEVKEETTTEQAAQADQGQAPREADVEPPPAAEYPLMGERSSENSVRSGASNKSSASRIPKSPPPEARTDDDVLEPHPEPVEPHLSGRKLSTSEPASTSQTEVQVGPPKGGQAD